MDTVTLLHLAVRIGRVSLVQHLLEQSYLDVVLSGVRARPEPPFPSLIVHERDGDGLAPFHKIAYCQDRGAARQIIHRLIFYGGDLNVLSCSWETPLSRACAKGNWGVVMELLLRAARPEPVDRDGLRPLHHCMLASSRSGVSTDNLMEEVVEALIRCGAHVDTHVGIGPTRADVPTPLMLAIDEGLPNIARVLLECGANPEIRGPGGKTALMLAAGRGDLLTVERLLVRLGQGSEHIETCDSDGLFVLDYVLDNAESNPETTTLAIIRRLRDAVDHLVTHDNHDRIVLKVNMLVGRGVLTSMDEIFDSIQPRH